MYRVIGIYGQQYGPVSADEIRRWLTENRVNGQSLVQPEGSPDWKPLSTFPEFANEIKALPPPPLSPAAAPAGYDPVASARASAKIPAGVCGILLGSFGVHK